MCGDACSPRGVSVSTGARVLQGQCQLALFIANYETRRKGTAVLEVDRSFQSGQLIQPNQPGHVLQLLVLFFRSVVPKIARTHRRDNA